MSTEKVITLPDGRSVSIIPLKPSEKFDLYYAPESVRTPMMVSLFMFRAETIASVRSIDGVPVPFPFDYDQMKARADQIGEEGLEFLMNNTSEVTDETESSPRKKVRQAKN